MGALAARKMLGEILILALSPTGSTCSQIWQYPRFLAKKRGSVVKIKCHMEVVGRVTWLWKQDMDSEPKELAPEPGRILQTQSDSNATLTIQDIQLQDNGIYFCQRKCLDESFELGCGTELRVMGGCEACLPAREGVGVDGARGVPGDTHTQPHPSLPPVRGHIMEVAVALEHPGELPRRGLEGCRAKVRP